MADASKRALEVTGPDYAGPREASQDLGTDLERGLSQAEARSRLDRYGRNEPAPIRPPSWRRTLCHQFASKLIWILAFATGVSLLLGEWINALAIGITVVFTTAIGYINEFRSERAIAALRELTARRAEVMREGSLQDVLAAELVVGDLIFIDEGDLVPADARIVAGRGLMVNESILTGEPASVAKAEAALSTDEESATAVTMVYAGTMVVAGSGRALVTATGRETSLGSIFQSIQGAERPATPLEQRLSMLGDRLIVAFLAITALLVLVGWAQGRDFRLIVETAVSLAIGAVPEGLPAVATIALAVAVRRLAAAGVLVRRLDAVETLGSTTVIVTDKTGTLTENRMALRQVLTGSGVIVDVALETNGDVLTTALSPHEANDSSALIDEARHILLLAAICNDAIVEYDAEDGWHAHGDPSEGALVLAAAGLGLDPKTLERLYPRTATIPFSSATRLMRTTHDSPDGMVEAIKGAPGAVSALVADVSQRLVSLSQELGATGYRVLAVAERRADSAPVLRGAVVLEDPVRTDAAGAIAAAHDAGLRVMLVTGDQKTTATSIAVQAGILSTGEEARTGDELENGSLDGVTVVARASHSQKEQIVRRLQADSQIVAMMGDGVNDAPALRASHVGVAVGPGATDVAVEASDIVVADGRLDSLVQGIYEGRQVTESLRRAIVYLLTASFGTITLISLAMLANQPLPLAALQILWLNIVVHVFPALALATSKQAAYRSSSPTSELFPVGTWIEVGWRAATTALAGLAALVLANDAFEAVPEIQTVVYLVAALVLIGQAFLIGVQSTREQLQRLASTMLWTATATSLGLLFVAIYVPGLRETIGLARPSGDGWIIVAIAVGGGLAVAQLGDLFGKRALSGWRG